MISRRLEALRIPLALAAVATALFYIGLFIVRPVLSALILRAPENYEYLARRSLERRDYDGAIRACERQLARELYNFNAHFLLAEILHRKGQTEAALERLWNLRDYYRAVLRRTMPSRGWDEARLHLLLARILWDLGRPEESLDQLQAAFDWHDPKGNDQCEQFVTAIRSAADPVLEPWGFAARAILDSKLALERVPDQMAANRLSPPPNFYTRLAQLAARRRHISTAHLLDAQEIRHYPRELPSLLAHVFFPQQPNWPGPNEYKKLFFDMERLTLGHFDFERVRNSPDYLTESYWAHLFRTTVATGTVQLTHPSRGICIVARGTVCDDVWPILSVRVGKKIIGQRYVGSTVYQVYTLPLALEPGTHTLGIGFENDASNPVAKRDRNLEIYEIRLY